MLNEMNPIIKGREMNNMSYCKYQTKGGDLTF